MSCTVTERNPRKPRALGIARCARCTAFGRVELQEAEKTILVEYDSTRLTEQVIHQLLRRAGLDVIERVALYQRFRRPPQPAATTYACHQSPSAVFLLSCTQAMCARSSAG